MANYPAYDAAAARADKLLEPDGSVQTASGTVVLPADPTRAQAYTQAAWRADKLLEPNGSVITGGGSGAATPPGGATGQVQYNNVGTFAGAPGINTDGNNLNVGGYTGALANSSPFVVGVGANTYFSVIAPVGNFTTGLAIRPGGTSGGAMLSGGSQSMLITTGNTNNVSIGYGGGGQPVAAFNINASATINGFNFAAAATGGSPTLSVVGGDANVSMKLTAKGTGAILCTSVVVTPVYTVATLPAAVAGLQGARALVTDATAPTFLGTLTGGGAVITPVFCTGTAWLAG